MIDKQERDRLRASVVDFEAMIDSGHRRGEPYRIAPKRLVALLDEIERLERERDAAWNDAIEAAASRVGTAVLRSEGPAAREREAMFRDDAQFHAQMIRLLRRAQDSTAAQDAQEGER